MKRSNFIIEKIPVKGFKKKCIALGAEQKSRIAVSDGNMIYLSAEFGDLKETISLLKFRECYNSIISEFDIEYAGIDLHPDYLTNMINLNNLKIKKIQHHFAHLLARTFGFISLKQLENNKYTGISFDGTGFGTDGNIWGGEFFRFDLNGFERIAYIKPVKILGGDIAVREIWRIALSYCVEYYGDNCFNVLNKIYSKDIIEKMKNVKDISDIDIYPLNSSIGRLFDAVASICGIKNNVSFEAEGAILLEKVIDKNEMGYYNYERMQISNNMEYQFDLYGIIDGIIKDLLSGRHISVISAKFHNSIIKMIIDFAVYLKEESGIQDIILSGGVFQNKYISNGSENKLLELGFNVNTDRKVSVTDYGISIGQLIAMTKNI